MMRFPTTVVLFLRLVGATITDRSQWPCRPGLNNLPICVKSIFGECSHDCSKGDECLSCHVGCGDWRIACNQISTAISLSLPPDVVPPTGKRTLRLLHLL